MDGISTVRGATPAISNRLDGDTLLLYCAKQMNDLNGDIDARLAQQQRMHDTKATLNDLRTLIGTDGRQYTPEARRQILTEFATVLKSMPPGPDYDNLKNQLQAFRQHAVRNLGDQSPPALPPIDEYLKTGIDDDMKIANGIPPEVTTNRFETGPAQQMSDAIGSVGENVGKNAELDMVSLQDLISKRQMAIQSTTQIMAKFNQGFEAIANNIK